MKTILITGAEGQLGKCLQKIAPQYPTYTFLYTTPSTLDITDPKAISLFFERHPLDYCINCAAYTLVEQAEKTPEKAFRVNAEGAGYLAAACTAHRVTLFYISTDYVFDGKKMQPYTETDLPNPINVYGRSKWEGEKAVKAVLRSYFIIRTSWLYSEFGKNFYKTILSKLDNQEEISVTDQQTGTPTNANDLAIFLMKIIIHDYKKYGTYHFSGGNIMTWYDFACNIVKQNQKQQRLKIVKTKNYHTFVKRPVYSALKPSIVPFDHEKKPSA